MQTSLCIRRRCADFKNALLFGVFGVLALAAFGCAGVQTPLAPSQGIGLTAGQSSSGTFERVDFTMSYRITYEASGRLQIEAQIFPKRRLSSLSIWLTAYDPAGRSLEKFLLVHSGHAKGYGHHGGRNVSQTLSMPAGTDFIAFSSVSSKKESR
ncbi:MAG TPA: hypothetical protein ACFCUC_07930 [Desulfobacterales bacterium]